MTGSQMLTYSTAAAFRFVWNEKFWPELSNYFVLVFGQASLGFPLLGGGQSTLPRL